jgi:hypothetical protein
MPRPPPPIPPPAPSDEDLCNPQDYEGFKEEELKELWKECCDNVRVSGKKDPDCDRPQW